jgi:hypothetical protein
MTLHGSNRRGIARARLRILSGPRSMIVALLGAVGLLSLGVAGASAGSVTLPGGPLNVSIGSLGQCESSYPNIGNNFFPPNGGEGDCGFFLAFPKVTGQATNLEGKVFGFAGSAGPRLGGSNEYTFIEQGPISGAGTVGDPYSEATKYKVSVASKDYAVITDVTSYVNGEAQFTSTYTVENVTGKAAPAAEATSLFFHAIIAGDLFVANDDHGTGVFLGGPPKFIGGRNPNTGTLGGFIEATPAWTNYQEGYWDGPEIFGSEDPTDQGIWNAVRIAAASTGGVFNDTIDPALIDNGAGASWDDHLEVGKGLAPGHTASYSIINRSQVPTTLGVQPVSQTLSVGQTATVKVTATDNVGTPYSGRPLVYSIGGANPKSGSVTTDSSGVATISYVGTAAGLDTMQMFLDLAGTGAQATQDPASTAQITWAPLPPTPPTPNSGYRVQSIHANSDGTITIVFVPVQDGTATVEVTVPTATISRNAAIAAKRKKCKRSQIRIKGKCRPKVTLSGKITASGKAGVALKLTVKPSSKVRKALKKGKTVQLTAKLIYKSKLGGKPVTQIFHVTVKAPKKKKRH